MKQLEKIFWDKGCRNYNGNKIAHSTMSGMIANPKYKGYYVSSKVKVVDMFTKKQKFLPPDEWVMFKDESGEIVPAIISEKLWERANEVLRKRGEDVKNRQGICNYTNIFRAPCGIQMLEDRYIVSKICGVIRRNGKILRRIAACPHKFLRCNALPWSLL